MTTVKFERLFPVGRYLATNKVKLARSRCPLAYDTMRAPNGTASTTGTARRTERALQVQSRPVTDEPSLSVVLVSPMQR